MSEKALVQKALHETTWDEGVIGNFVGNAAVQCTVWTIGHHKVIFYATPEESRKGKAIATTCWELWNWLGVKRPFTLVLWWRDDPRLLAADAWPSKRNVNGGWTYQNSSTIFVYRAEEWDRVFLHEMIHALGWDWKMPSTPLGCWGLPSNSNIHPALFEAWTELYAEWLWCVWHGSSFSTWLRQRIWQDTQALQICARYVASGDGWKEDTSVFAYYVLKAALAPNIAHFLLFDPRGSETILCQLTASKLKEFYRVAARVNPVAISLRMTAPISPQS